MNRIAVTGATGFIGRFLIVKLHKEGIDVVAIGRSSTPPRISVFKYYNCTNYLDLGLLADAFARCSAVVHLASLAHQTGSKHNHDALLDYRNANVIPLVSVARAAAIANVKRVVFISSIGVNGSSTSGIPFSELDLPSPQEPYSLSKLEAEQALSTELAGSTTDWVILRPPLVYGFGCPGNLGRLIHMVYSMPLLPFGALHSRRTIISAENLADAISIACIHPAVSRKEFVVADNIDITVTEIVSSIMCGLGRSSWRLIPVPSSWIEFCMKILRKKALWFKFSSELRVDSSAFCRATGWAPKVRSHQGLEQMAHFMLNAKSSNFQSK